MSFTSIGLEHCVANMYVVPMGMLQVGAWASGRLEPAVMLGKDCDALVQRFPAMHTCPPSAPVPGAGRQRQRRQVHHRQPDPRHHWCALAAALPRACASASMCSSLPLLLFPAIFASPQGLLPLCVPGNWIGGAVMVGLLNVGIYGTPGARAWGAWEQGLERGQRRLEACLPAKPGAAHVRHAR